MAHHGEMLPERKVLVLLGPTASGKTQLSLLVAPKLHAEIISADSRQIYTYLTIGTAKPSSGDRKIVPHYFVDVLAPDCSWNAGEFGKEGRRIIEDIFHRGKTPFIVGGSGLYIRSLIDGFFEGPGADDTLRKELYARLREIGSTQLLEELRNVDPAAASRMLPSNTRRIVRALEIFRLTGKPISELQQQRIPLSFQPVIVGVQWDRKALYHRIDERVERMIRDGLVEEVRGIQKMGFLPTMNALQTTGYAEVFLFLEGKISHAEMVALIKRNTRRYAKRQMTWFRQDKRIEWFTIGNETEFENLADRILTFFLQ